MKKVLLICVCILVGSSGSFAQNNGDEGRDSMPSFQKQMERMQKELMKMFGGMGKGMNMDSLGSMNMGMDTGMVRHFGNMQMDTSGMKSYGFMFDGDGWKSLPGGDSTQSGGDMMRLLQEHMKMFGNGMNMEDMMKQFGGASPYIPSYPSEDSDKKKKKKEKGDSKYELSLIHI